MLDEFILSNSGVILNSGVVFVVLFVSFVYFFSRFLLANQEFPPVAVFAIGECPLVFLEEFDVFTDLVRSKYTRVALNLSGVFLTHLFFTLYFDVTRVIVSFIGVYSLYLLNFYRDDYAKLSSIRSLIIQDQERRMEAHRRRYHSCPFCLLTPIVYADDVTVQGVLSDDVVPEALLEGVVIQGQESQPGNETKTPPPNQLQYVREDRTQTSQTSQSTMMEHKLLPVARQISAMNSSEIDELDTCTSRRDAQDPARAGNITYQEYEDDFLGGQRDPVELRPKAPVPTVAKSLDCDLECVDLTLRSKNKRTLLKAKLGSKSVQEFAALGFDLQEDEPAGCKPSVRMIDIMKDFKQTNDLAYAVFRIVLREESVQKRITLIEDHIGPGFQTLFKELGPKAVFPESIRYSVEPESAYVRLWNAVNAAVPRLSKKKKGGAFKGAFKVRTEYFIAKADGKLSDVRILKQLPVYPLVPRGTTAESARAHLLGVAYKLQRSGLKKYQKVVACQAAWVLLTYREHSCAKSQIDRLISNSRVYVFNFREEEKEEHFSRKKEVTFSEFLPKTSLSLTVCNHVITSLSEFECNISAFGKKSKKLIMGARMYFSGEELTVPLHSIESGLTKNMVLSLGEEAAYSFQWLSEPEVVVQGKTPEEKELWKMLEFSAFLTAFLTAKGPVNAVASLTQYLAANEYLRDLLWDKVQALIEFSGKLSDLISLDGIQVQGTSDWTAELFSRASAIIFDCALFALTAGQQLVFEQMLPVFRTFFSHVQFDIMRDAARDFAEYVVQKVKEFIGKLQRCWETGTMDPLFRSELDPVKWTQMTTIYEQHYKTFTSSSTADIRTRLEMIADGLIPSYWKATHSANDFYNVCVSHLNSAGPIRKVYSGSIEISRGLQKAYASFKEFVLLMHKKLSGSALRCQAFGVMLIGEPAVGKSVLVRRIKHSIGMAHGLDTGNDTTYNWQADVNFQDGLTHTQWCVVADDLDQQTYQPAGSNPCSDMVHLINNQPQPIEAARIEEKGQNFANPYLVIWTGNKPNCKINLTSVEPHAFFRRFPLRAIVRVKPEYLKEDGLIDAEKTASTYDIHEFEVFLYSKNVKKGLPYVKYGNLNYSEFMRLTLKLYKAHMKGQALVLKRDVSCPSLVCKLCFSDISEMSCGCGASGLVPPEGLKPLPLEELIESLAGPTKCQEQLIPALTQAELDSVVVMGGFSSKMAPVVPEQQVPLDGEEDDSLCEDDEAFHDLSDEEEGVCGSRCCRRGSLLAGVVKNMVKNTIFDYGMSELLKAYLLRLKAIVFSRPFQICLAFLAGAWFSKNNSVVQGDRMTSLPEGKMHWKEAGATFPPSIPFRPVTWDRDGITNAIVDCSVKVKGPLYTVNGLAVNNQFVLTTTHVLSTTVVPAKERTLNVDPLKSLIFSRGSVEIVIPIAALEYAPLASTPELILVRVPGLRGRDLLPFMMPERDTSVSSFDRTELWTQECLGSVANAYVKKCAHGLIIEAKMKTTSGACGAAYLAETPRGVRLVAMHWAGDGANTALGLMFWSNELSTIISRLGYRVQGLMTVESTLFQSPPDSIVPLPEFSEARVACEKGAFIDTIGMSLPKKGVTLRSQVRYSLLHDQLVDKCAELTERPDWWGLPHLKGSMFNGVWTSPMSNALQHCKSIQLDKQLMYLAVFDYLSGFDRGNVDGYRALSQNEALMGVDGSVINGVDLTTSIGPPRGGPKRNFIFKGDGVAYAEPWVIDQSSFLVESLRSNILCVAAQDCVKDEAAAYKAGAPFDRKIPRIFINVSATFNIALKQILGPLVIALRANKYFFEMAIGIDMTSHECNDIVEYLRRWAPDLSLPCIVEQDVKAMDKSWKAQHFDAVGLVGYGIAKAMGLDAVAVENALVSAGNCIHTYQSDHYFAYQLPSGILTTVEMNSMNLSLGARYGYYLQMKIEDPAEFERRFPKTWFEQVIPNFYSNPFPQGEFTFRAEVGMITYGDDVLRVGKDIKTEYLDSWGLTFQSATDKTLDSGMFPITQVSFLKRNFVFDPLLKRFKAPLSLKSMARTLLIKKHSDLTLHDHAGVSITEFLREMAYHGKEMYDEWSGYLRKVADECGIQTAYLEILPYEVLFQKMLDKNYRSWVNRGERLSIMEDDFTTVKHEVIRADEVKGEFPLDSFEVQGDVGLRGAVRTVKVLHSVKRPDTPRPVPLKRRSIPVELSSRRAVERLMGKGFCSDNPGFCETSLEDFQVQGDIEPQNLVHTVYSDPVASTGQMTTAVSQPLPDYVANSLLNRKVLLYNHPISSFDSTFDQVMFDPLEVLTADPVVLSVIDKFRLWRGSFRITVITSIAPMCGGRATISLFPIGGNHGSTAIYRYRNQHPENSSQGDIWVEIDFSQSNNVEIVVPFFHYLDYCLTSNSKNLWHCYITTIIPLVGGIDSTPDNGNIAIYGSFMPDMELVAPIYPVPEVVLGDEEEELVVQGRTDAVRDSPTIAKGVGIMTSAVSNVFKAPSLKSITGLIRGVGSGLGVIADALGFSRMSSQAPVTRTLTSQMSSVANAAGPDNSRSLSFMPDCVISSDPRVVGSSDGVDILSFESLASRWTIVDEFEFAPTNAAGDELLRIPVTPFLAIPVAGSLVFQALAQAGLLFKLWNGTVRFKIVFGVSAAHRGSLQILHNPDNVTLIGVDLTNYLQNAVIELSAGKEFIFEVGYTSDKPFLQTGWPGYTAYPLDFANGFLHIRVNTPLRSQAATTIKGVIYMCCGPDMQFQRPADGNYLSNDLGQQEYYPLSQFVCEGTIGNEEGEDATIVLVPSLGSYPYEIGFGENIRSVRALMQKPSRLFGGGGLNGTFFKFAQGGPPMDHITTSVDPYPASVFTYQKFLSYMYAGISHSEKVRGVTSREAIVRATVDNYSEMHTYDIADRDTGFEIVYPNYDPKKFYDPSLISQTAILEYGWKVNQLWIYPTNNSDTEIFSQLWYSYGPDIRAVRFRGSQAIANTPYPEFNQPFQSPHSFPETVEALSSTQETASLQSVMAPKPNLVEQRAVGRGAKFLRIPSFKRPGKNNKEQQEAAHASSFKT